MSLALSIKEWKSLFAMILATALSYIGVRMLLFYFTHWWAKITYISLIILSIILYFTALGIISRKIYKKEERISLSTLLKKSFFSTLVILVFIALWSGISYGINQSIEAKWVIYVVLIPYTLVALSATFECVRVFFLEKEIFSIYAIFSRIISWRFLKGYIIAGIIFGLSYPITQLTSQLAIHLYSAINPWIGAVFAVLSYSIIIAIISLISIAFLLLYLDIDAIEE